MLNALNPEGAATGQVRPHQNFFSDTLQAPGFFGNIGGISETQELPEQDSEILLKPESNLQVPGNQPPQPPSATILTSTVIPQQNVNGRIPTTPFRGPSTALGGLGRPGASPPLPPNAPLPPRPPRPPNFPQNNAQTGIVPPLPPPIPPNNAPPSVGNTAVNSANGSGGQQSQGAVPNRQGRPLFNLIPRLPNFSELFGI